MKICPTCLKQYDDTAEFCDDDGQALKRFRDQTSQMLGQVLDDRWIIEQKIGAGGMGEVYRGRQISVDRKVAIKIMRLALASDEKYAARFFREANLASQIQHPHFVTIHDFGQTPDQIFYLVMEHLVGESLSRRLERGILPLSEIIEICSQICSALTAAHTRNVVHRDLKPDNVFMIEVAGEESVFVKVLDFGIAKDLGDDEKMTQTGQIFGTPEYMSPEQCQGLEVDQRSDLYSVGCILYELLAGFSPFHRDSALQTLLAQVSMQPPTYEALDLPVPDLIRTISWTLLEKNPDNRYPSAEDAKAAFDHALQNLETFEIEAFDASQTRLESASFKAFPTMSLRDTEPDPLGLEDHLSLTVKDAIRAQAAQQMFNESEQSTAEIDEEVDDVDDMPNPRIRPVLPFVFTVLLIAGLGFGAWKLSELRTVVDASPMIDIARQSSFVAISKASEKSSHDGVLGEARRLARRSGMQAEAFASVATVRPKKTARKNRSHSRDLVAIRTSTFIETYVKRKQKVLARCYARRKDRELAGAYEFAFTILPNGRVADVELGARDFHAPKVDQCVTKTIKGWRFPKSESTDRHERRVVFRTSNNN